MSKVRTYRISWTISASSDVVGYKIYYAPENVNYTSPFVSIGAVDNVTIPNDIPDFPLIDGTYEIGIAAVDDVGNESDLTVVSAPFDLVAPDAPTNLVVEAV